LHTLEQQEFMFDSFDSCKLLHVAREEERQRDRETERSENFIAFVPLVPWRSSWGLRTASLPRRGRALELRLNSKFESLSPQLSFPSSIDSNVRSWILVEGIRGEGFEFERNSCCDKLRWSFLICAFCWWCNAMASACCSMISSSSGAPLLRMP
jgi:hypothetical protein